MEKRSATGVVRDELAHHKTSKACDQRAELAGMLRSIGALHLIKGGMALEATTNEPLVARRLYAALADALGARGQVRMIEPGRGHPRARYAVRIEEVSIQRLVELGLLDERGAPGQRVGRRVVAKRCCVGAFLRGSFIGRGSVGDPRRPAHLEFRTDGQDAAEEIVELLARIDVGAKVRDHNGWAAYVKEVAAVGEALAAMGAHNAYLSWEDATVWKSVHMAAGRLANADAANAGRLSQAAFDQREAIVALGPRLSTLPPAQQEAAALRLDNPEASIAELASLARPAVSKGAMAGRLARLREAAGFAGPAAPR